MYEFQISYILYRPDDITVLKGILRDQKIDTPIFIINEGDRLLVKMTTDYEHWELDHKIEQAFSGYEFSEDIGRGRPEIRVQVNRYQSNFTDDWGRPIEDRLDDTKYLIRKGLEKQLEFQPKIEAMFFNEERDYYINIVPGINKATQEKGYLIIDSFDKLDEHNETDAPFIQHLYRDSSDAFWSAFNKMETKAEQDFKTFVKKKKMRRG